MRRMAPGYTASAVALCLLALSTAMHAAAVPVCLTLCSTLPFCVLLAQDLRDRTYYLSNGVIRVGGRRVATNAANFTKGDIVGVVLDADQVGLEQQCLQRLGHAGAAVGCLIPTLLSAPALPGPYGNSTPHRLAPHRTPPPGRDRFPAQRH